MKKRSVSQKQRYEALPWENSLRVLLTTGLATIGVGAYADTPTALVGGATNSSAAYAAFVSSSGSITPISNLPAATSELFGVAINGEGTGLIGGIGADGNGYAAFVSAEGSVTPIAISFSDGTILSTSINQTGVGLIGGTVGGIYGTGGGYTALISPDGTVSSFPLTVSSIAVVELNDSGAGLIGGEGGGMAGPVLYAASIVGGTLNPISTPATFPGNIYGVAVNDLGQGIFGGNTDSVPYGAFVVLTDNSLTLLTNLPSGGSLQSVAINQQGLGLVGGYDNSSNVYIGYADPINGNVTPFSTPFSGMINSVAINNSGAGLAGGQTNGTDLYAALVQSNGTTIIPLFTDSVAGEILSVAINQEGVGLIGGNLTSGPTGYAALVAPNGTLTVLDMSNQSGINSVALALSNVTPKSIGPYLSAVYTQLAASLALESRFAQQNRIWTQTKAADVAQNELNLSSNEEEFALEKRAAPAFKKNSIWIAPFGGYVKLKEQGTIPSYTNEIGGALLAYDHRDTNYMVGASLGYAFNYVQYSEALGHAKVQEEMACLYGAYYLDHFRLNAAAWGGLYQFWNVRHTLGLTTSESLTHGWILDPHLELASPWAIDRQGLYSVEPFAMVDWVNSWQRQFSETGDAGLNIKVGSLYGSLLQSEVGVRFYEQFEYNWGNFKLEEKVSYVNQAPFNFTSATTSFVGSASTFPIAVASTTVQNLAAAQLMCSFFPSNASYPFGGFMAQVTANSSYQSYFLNLFTGADF